MDVLCVGQIVADILVKPIEALDFSVDTQIVDPIQIKSGGDCLNAAIALSRLGNKVCLCGKLGQDNFGEMLRGIIEDAGIDARGLSITQDAATSSVLVAINSKGERAFFYHGGANEKLELSDIDSSLIEECKIVHVGGTCLLPRLDGNGTAELFRRAKALGKRTSMDVTWDTSGRWLDIIRPCLPHLDYFMPSIGEARHITKREDPRAIAQFLLDEGVGTAVIKLGKEGCLIKNAREEYIIPAFRVNTVDTTGAGDCFVAGFISGVIRGWPLTECARLACAVAAMCVTQIGATAGVKGFAETMEFIKINT